MHTVHCVTPTQFKQQAANAGSGDVDCDEVRVGHNARMTEEVHISSADLCYEPSAAVVKV